MVSCFAYVETAFGHCVVVSLVLGVCQWSLSKVANSGFHIFWHAFLSYRYLPEAPGEEWFAKKPQSVAVNVVKFMWNYFMGLCVFLKRVEHLGMLGPFLELSFLVVLRSVSASSSLWAPLLCGKVHRLCHARAEPRCHFKDFWTDLDIYGFKILIGNEPWASGSNNFQFRQKNSFLQQWYWHSPSGDSKIWVICQIFSLRFWF